MIDAAAHFSRTYREARDRFLAAAAARHCAMAAKVHPYLRDPDGGELAIDIASCGDPAAKAVLVVSSGTHGVEGFAGSAIQAAWLGDDACRAIDGGGVRIVMLHALNPWGFANDTRGDENNVDLNRNFRDFTAPQPANDAYAMLHPLLVPGTWPPPWTTNARLRLAILRRGRHAVQHAISRGQCEFADGLFYGGAAPSWSNRMLRAALAEQCAGCAALGWIDLHTGLGRRGQVEAIFNGPDDPRELARARRWWGDGVTSMYDRSAVSSHVNGANFTALQGTAVAVRAAITVECGTHSPWVVLDALRARQWLANHPHVARGKRRAILAQSRDAFLVDTGAWKVATYSRARILLRQGVDALQREAAMLG